MARFFDLSSKQLQGVFKTNFRNEDVYLYVIKTIRFSESGKFLQSGSAPNFQRCEVTLCTCKYFMRSFRIAERWRNTWVAGFSGSQHGGKNSIVYLMRIDSAYADFNALWQDLPEQSKCAKDASINPLGDVYRPVKTCADPHSHQYYKKPVEGHSHMKEANPDAWIFDIEVRYRKGFPPLLHGAASNTFSWSVPQLELPFQLHRGQKKMKMSELVQIL